MSDIAVKNADDKKRIKQDLTKAVRLARQNDMILPYIVESPLPEINILDWLSTSEANQKWYWQDREGQFEFGGIGAAVVHSSNDSPSVLDNARKTFKILPDSKAIFFSGKRFADYAGQDDLWISFPEDLCVIPETIIVREKSNYTLRYCLPVEPQSDIEILSGQIEELRERDHPAAEHLPLENIPHFVVSSQSPNYERWCRQVMKVLNAIKADHLEKVVLARHRKYIFRQEITPLSLFKLLLRDNPNCFGVLCQPDPSVVLISVTPELLFRRDGQRLEIDAISSTLPRGDTKFEDSQLAQKLLSNDKLRREHQYVVDGINHTISSLCDADPTIGEISVLKLDRLQHLRVTMTGRLSDNVDDDQIRDLIHPTPAVGGTPRDKAIEMINELEDFDRGWYAGPIGYITGTDSEFVIAIRSVLVRGRRISVFTGAGIVEGSHPDMEWREINSKDILLPYFSKKVSG